MSLTLIVTRDVAARYRGFLSSVMPELAPGVYVSTDMTKGVRDRVWAVASDWWDHAPGGSIVMAYPDAHATGRLGVRVLGLPPVELADVDGVRLVVRRGGVWGGGVRRGVRSCLAPHTRPPPPTPPRNVIPCKCAI